MKAISIRQAAVLIFVGCLCACSIAGQGRREKISRANAKESSEKDTMDLVQAARNGNLARVKSILTENPPLVNAKGPYETTPLHAAMEAGHKEIVQFLIARGADVNAKQGGPIGLAPLHIAAFKDYKELAELLLAAGASVNAIENSGKTALHGAGHHGRKQMAELLIAKGADVNAKDEMNKTALDYALKQGHAEIAALLRAHGAEESPSSIPAAGADKNEDVTELARRLFGQRFTRTAPRKVSPLVSRLCGPYKFYSVTVHQERYIAGFGPERTYLMAYGKRGFKLSNAKEVASFLASLKKPVSSELEVLERAVVFAELIGRKVRTRMPKRKSLIKELEQQKPEDWPVVISGTDAGWMIAVTLWRINDRDLENCWRYELSISKNGETSIASERHVYQYAALE